MGGTLSAPSGSQRCEGWYVFPRRVAPFVMRERMNDRIANGEHKGYSLRERHSAQRAPLFSTHPGAGEEYAPRCTHGSRRRVCASLYTHGSRRRVCASLYTLLAREQEESTRLVVSLPKAEGGGAYTTGCTSLRLRRRYIYPGCTSP